MDQQDSQPKFELEKNELNAVLSSKLFLRAPSLINFLNYVCRKRFEGTADQIKEYNIATEAFGRSEDFQQKEDPIVRVEANRLRKRLAQYYETEGANHQIRLTIPPGQYAPAFVQMEKVPTPSILTINKAEEAGTIATGPIAVAETGPSSSVPKETPAPRSNYFPIAPWMIDEVVGSAPQPGEVQDVGISGPDTPSVIERGATSAAAHVPPKSLYGTFSWPRWSMLILGVSVIVAIFFIGYRMRSRGPSTISPSQRLAQPTAEVTVPLMTGPENSIRLLAGSALTQYVDYLGHVWQGDAYFTGGTPVHFPNLSIAVTQDPEIYRSAREGDFSYDIPLKPNTYELRLHFSENTYGSDTPDGGGESSRLVNVTANGRKLLDQFDILSDAGGGKTADIKVFKDITPENGFLRLAFSGFKVKGVVSGIEVVPSSPGRALPVRITTRNTAHFSKDQKLWEVDRFFRGGRQVQRNVPIQGTDDPELFQSDRFGNFAYIIPVSQGRYQLNLFFAENDLKTSGSPGQSSPTRLFNVFCNGEALLKNFDVAREAGGINHSLIKHFQGIKPNAQDKIILNFVPISHYATVSALEVLPED